MSTDFEWERWGRQDPYFGVITDERFRSDRLNDDALAEFFASGQHHVDGVMASCRKYFGGDFTPRRILDFGCGVGRLLVAFARDADEVVGLDISESMLAEAARNCATRKFSNVRLYRSDDQLSRARGHFDLVHSAITLQHIDVARGRRIVQALLQRLAPGGVMAIQLTYAKAYHPATFGRAPVSLISLKPTTRGFLARLFRRRGADAAGGSPNANGTHATRDPQMLMNSYNLNEIAFILQAAGIKGWHAEFTDHGGELGVFLFLRRT